MHGMFFITYLCDLGHKTSHQSWINKLSIDVWFVRTGSYLAEKQLFENLESEGAKKNYIDKIALKVVQMKFLAMHVTNPQLRFDVFTVGNLQNIFMEHELCLNSNDFWHYKWIIWPTQCSISYCYKYTRASYDWFCGPQKTHTVLFKCLGQSNVFARKHLFTEVQKQ